MTGSEQIAQERHLEEPTPLQLADQRVIQAATGWAESWRVKMGLRVAAWCTTNGRLVIEAVDARNKLLASAEAAQDSGGGR